MSEIMNVEEAANYLRVKKSTLYAWACQERGPKRHKQGRLVRYYKTDLDAFMKGEAVAVAPEVTD